MSFALINAPKSLACIQKKPVISHGLRKWFKDADHEALTAGSPLPFAEGHIFHTVRMDAGRLQRKLKLSMGLEPHVIVRHLTQVLFHFRTLSKQPSIHHFSKEARVIIFHSMFRLSKNSFVLLFHKSFLNVLIQK